MAMTQPMFQQNDNHPHITGDCCPTCDQPVPNQKFKEIQARLEADQRERAAAMDRRLKEQVAQEKAAVEAQAKLAIEQVQSTAAAELLKAKEEAATKEAAAREAAKKEVEAAMLQKMTETEQAKAAAEQQLEVLKTSNQQIEAQSKAAVLQAQNDAAAAVSKAQQEAVVKEQAAREAGKQEAATAAAQKVAELEQAKILAEQQLQAAKTDQEALLNQRLLEQREALEQAKTEAVNVEKKKAFDDKLKLEGKVQELQRQIQQKTAEELGEGAEVNLYEALKAEFPSDKIDRVEKGTPGADIIHTVINNGIICGIIVYDSKNRNQWRNEYVEKLRQDQLAARADHAVLSTHVFPAGTRQLHVKDSVILVNPARAVVLAQVLRKQVIQCHGLRLSNEARNEKTECLYNFIMSERCSQLLEQIDTLTDDMLELEVKEVRAHEATWKRRGELIRLVQRANSDFTNQIDLITGTAQPSEAAAQMAEAQG